MTITSEPLTGVFVADQAHSTFAFTLRHMKVASFTARFDEVEARAVIDGDSASIEGVVKVESVSIRSPKEFRDHVLYGADFFDAKAHPEIRFLAREVALAEDGSATVHGELTIKGTTKPFVATGTYQPPVEDPFGAVRSAVEMTAVVDRRDWGLDWQAPLPKGDDVLSWDVTLTAQVEFVKAG